MFKYTAMMIEPRKHDAFSFVLHNFLENLSEEWGFVLFHGSDNSEFVKDIIYELPPQYRYRIISVVNLHVDNLNGITYSNLFFSNELYQHIPTETFLVFQTDSMILNKGLVDSFLEYDYVGAPWKSEKVGNGGLSLRKKSKMLEIIKAKPVPDHRHEDIYFTHNIPSHVQYHLPSFEEAKQFAIETVFHDSPFGIHNAWRYIKHEELKILTTKTPELDTLIRLQTWQK